MNLKQTKVGYLT